jgi:hypothetical protein
LIQLAATAGEGQRPGSTIGINRLAGIPVLFAIGLFPELRSQWFTLAVFVVCVGEVIADLRSRAIPVAAAMSVSILEKRMDEPDQTSL